MTDTQIAAVTVAESAIAGAAAAGRVIPPAATAAPVDTLKGHPWEPAVFAGRAFAAELARVGAEGRTWVLAEVGVASNGKAAFVLGLGVGITGTVIGVPLALLVGRAFGL